jgi:hypothetical protein
LYAIIIFKDQGNFRNIDMQNFLNVGYQNALLESNSQSKCDVLSQLHMLDLNEDDKDRSWVCTQVLSILKGNGMDGNTSYDLL